MFPFEDIYYMVKHFFEKQQWYRRRKGGKWSRQFIEPCKCHIWLQGWKREPAAATEGALFESYPDLGNRCEECSCQTAEDRMVVTDYSYSPQVHLEVTRYVVDGFQQCGCCREAMLVLNSKEW